MGHLTPFSRQGAARRDISQICLPAAPTLRNKDIVPVATRRRRSAFSLLEVMISLFILAAGAVMYYALIPMSFKTGAMVGNYQQAASLVQHKIDQLRGVGFGRLTYTELLSAGIIDNAPASSPYSFNAVDGLNSLFPQSTATISVADFDGNIKQVTVTLTWTGSASKQGNGTLSATALVARS